MTMVTLRCEFCSKGFEPKRKTAKFCSSACLESRVMPRVSTSFSIRRVETPSR